MVSSNRIDKGKIGLVGGVNTYAYVRNNPVNWVDPFGLTQEDVNWGQEVLRSLHPEYFDPNANVNFGDVDPGESGGTSFFGKEITLSKEYSGPLDEDQQIQLLETLAHEYQHSNDSLETRLRTNIEDLLGVKGRHYEIYKNALNLSREAYRRMVDREIGTCP
jgi:uncharacterized protein RhaS with RHS repeats